uniref:G_PROTEIN_RECEP_F3_4 domain-containing protein n=1 Tax=Rhabditophanes sp. KR3021 TaxID=114890 RepID=A0AC35UG01_9BILA
MYTTQTKNLDINNNSLYIVQTTQDERLSQRQKAKGMKVTTNISLYSIKSNHTIISVSVILLLFFISPLFCNEESVVNDIRFTTVSERKDNTFKRSANAFILNSKASVSPENQFHALLTNNEEPSNQVKTPNSLDAILKELENRTGCDRTISGSVLSKIINESLTGDLRDKILWISKTVATHPHLYSKDVPLSANIFNKSIFNHYPETPFGAIHNRPGKKVVPTFGLHLKCDTDPEWTAVVVYPTSDPHKYLHATLPLKKLDACNLANCKSSKCSFTSYNSFTVYSKQCCSTAEQAFCVTDTNSYRQMYYIFNLLCMVLCLILIPVVLLERRRQRHEARGWALMELFLVGAIVLYSIVVLDKINILQNSCAYAIWLRQIGFSTFYGAIVLKIYRNLQEYRVRKAHHVFVKEKDLMKYMAALLILTITGLLAWSFGSWSDGTLWDAIWPQCHIQSWTLVWHIYELIFLTYAMRLCYKARNSSWMERWQFTIAICLEAIVTLSANTYRYFYGEFADAGTLTLITFAQLQGTVTINILIIMAPKFYMVTSETNRRTLTMAGSSGRAHPSLAKLRDNLINGTIDFAEVPIVDMNPEDIRAELKRVYTQLRMYKLKNIYQDNPHISKRKGGKKSTDKVSKIRRISLPQSTSSPKSIKKVDEEDEEKSDHTVESAAHNVYLSSAKRMNFDGDESVRV